MLTQALTELGFSSLHRKVVMKAFSIVRDQVGKKGYRMLLRSRKIAKRCSNFVQLEIVFVLVYFYCIHYLYFRIWCS